VLRLAIGPSPRRIECPPGYRLTRGRGWTVREGRDAVLFAYGPVMLHEALVAADHAGAHGVSVRVVNQPWLNVFDADWLASLLRPYHAVFVLEDHGTAGGLGDRLLATLAAEALVDGRRFHVFGVTGLPACGTPTEALAAHGLDGASLARRLVAAVHFRPV
jgi:transketolase